MLWVALLLPWVIPVTYFVSFSIAFVERESITYEPAGARLLVFDGPKTAVEQNVVDNL